jgi:glucokinase
MQNKTGFPDFALAIDIGGTKVAITTINSNGEQLTPIEKHFVPFNDNHVADLKKLIDLIAPYVVKARQFAGNLMGIGLSCCGNIDVKTGMAVLVPNLHWRYVPICEMVQKEFNLPVFAATDVRMAVLGEVAWGAAKGIKNFAWATIGTGFGGYLYLDGRLYDGFHGFAGNFGHMTLDEIDGYPCGCGRDGCFETFVAGPGIARAGQKAAESGISPYLKNIASKGMITARDVFEGEAAGDAGAHAVIEEEIRLICINLGGLVNILDLEMIIIGGGITNASSDFISRIDRRIRDFLMTEEAIRDLIILKESFDNSSLTGAAADVFYRQGIISI